MDYSQITIVGRVQPRDAEVRYTQGGSQVLTWRMVVNRKRKVGDTWEDAADWYQVSCFGKLAETMADKATKGERLMVCGRFSTRTWTDNDGREHTNLEIMANDVILLSERPRQETQQQPEREADLNDLPF